ncbi:MAG TPA: ATP-binding protein [Methylomirabilota bacterium]
MIRLLAVIVAVSCAALAVFVWRSSPNSAINRRFAACTLCIAAWSAAICGVYGSSNNELWGRLSFASASLIPVTFLSFAHAYGTYAQWLPRPAEKIVVFVGCIFAALSLTTPLVASEFSVTAEGLSRRTGPMYPLFGAYFVVTWMTAVAALASKWRHATGQARAQFQYFGAGLILSGIGGITANLVLPLFTGRSTYSWLGPYFALILLALTAHTIIRHRLMDLRLVLHRGLTLAVAIILSLSPVVVLFGILWPRLRNHLRHDEIVILAIAAAVVGLLIPITKDLAESLLDRYAYRTRTNYRRVVREASKALTRVLVLKTLSEFLHRTIDNAVRAEGVQLYLLGHDHVARAISDARHAEGKFSAPAEAPASVMAALRRRRELIVADELARRLDDGEVRALHADLARMNWALVLPLLSEDTVLGAIVLGAKRSGDAYYPQDLDLLTTLANQAGIAIKNAQLYAEIVLAKEYLQNIVGTIESGVVAINEWGQVTMFNRGAEELTGLRAGDVQGRPVAALPACLAEALGRTLADGQALTQPEIELPGPDRTLPVMCTTSLLRDDGGAALGAVAVFSDLTPLKTLEIERRRAERLAYFEALASGISHEIKNPLVSIKTFAQLIARRRDDATFIDDFSRIVGREIGHIERLLERLSALSRPSDRPQLRLDLRTPIVEALESLQPTLDEKGVTARLRLGERPVLVLGDDAQLKQLFMNLFINAHEATPPGGALTVELSVSEEQVTVTVDDTGPGIPPALLECIFEPFFSTRQRGSGLGLAICAGIAGGHRARLSASNRADGGARFTIELPLVAAVSAPAPA